MSFRLIGKEPKTITGEFINATSEEIWAELDSYGANNREPALA